MPPLNAVTMQYWSCLQTRSPHAPGACFAGDTAGAGAGGAPPHATANSTITKPGKSLRISMRSYIEDPCGEDGTPHAPLAIRAERALQLRTPTSARCSAYGSESHGESIPDRRAGRPGAPACAWVRDRSSLASRSSSVMMATCLPGTYWSDLSSQDVETRTRPGNRAHRHRRPRRLRRAHRRRRSRQPRRPRHPLPRRRGQGRTPPRTSRSRPRPARSGRSWIEQSRPTSNRPGSRTLMRRSATSLACLLGTVSPS